MSEENLLLEMNLLQRLLSALTDDNAWALVVEIITPDGIVYRFSM